MRAPIGNGGLAVSAKRGRARALACAVAVVVVTLAAPGAGSDAATTDSRTARLVGTLDRFTPTAIATWGERVVPPRYRGAGKEAISNQDTSSGTAIVVPEARQLWQLYPFPPKSGELSPPTGVVVLDLDTLRPLTTFLLGELRRGGSLINGEWMHAVDGGNRLFLYEKTAKRNAAGTMVFVEAVVEVDLRTFGVRRLPVSEPLMVAGQKTSPEPYGAAGITFDEALPGPGDDAILVFYAGPGIALNLLGTGSTALQRIPLDGGPAQNRTVRACTGTPPGIIHGDHYSSTLLVTPEYLFVPCQRSGYTALVVRLPRSSAFERAGPEDEVAGPVYLDTTLIDPRGQRMFVVTASMEIWVFDAKAMAFVGVIAAKDKGARQLGFGVDERTGRVFFQSPDYGFGMIEGRFFPVPQAVRTPGSAAAGHERIFSDTQTGRVFVLDGWNLDRPRHYKIYDTGTAPPPPPPPDPDRNTADIDEAPGRTEARYFASGSGYAMRALVVKGVSTLPPTVSVGQPTTGAVINDYVNLDCGYSDREFVAAQVSNAEYDTGSTSASAIAATIDEGSKVDFEQPSRCDLTVRSGGNEVFSGAFSTAPAAAALDRGPGWGYGPASCSSSQGEKGSEAGGKDPEGRPSLGRSSVVCPVPGGRLEARAETALSGGIEASQTWTDVRIEPTAKGAVSVVRSVVTDLSIADGLVRIGEIRAEARSTANGRPRRDPMSTHTVRMANVSVRGQSLCGDVCDPAAVAKQLNQAGLGRVEFRALTGRDDDLLRGSPRGALTAVQKSTRHQASDAALFGDPRPEVPVFEMIVYNDNTEFGRARQVYQFAGVASAANYNVVLLPAFGALLGDDEDGPTRPDGLSLDVEAAEGSSLTTVGDTAAVDVPAGIVERVGRALRALARGLRLMLTDPRRAFLVLTAWLVLMAPGALARRRRLLVEARTS